MTRIMGDATHDNVSALAADRGSIQLAAGYVTGTPEIIWTPSDWASFPGLPLVTIDQGADGSPVAAAMVRDVEPGAWSAAAAVVRTGWTTPRPTIYISLDSLDSLESAGWQGDVWVADYTYTAPSSPPAVPAGMTCVAMQYTDQGGGGAYDLSVVFDPTWPSVQGDDMLCIRGASGAIYLLSGGRLHHVLDPTDLTVYTNAGVAITAGTVSAAEEAALLSDFAPGNPSVSVGSIQFPAFTVTPEAS